MSPAFSQLAVLGVGYIGGSVALAARQAGLVSRVIGYDADADALRAAKDQGIIDDAAVSPQAAVKGARVVMLAAPVASLAALVRDLSPALAPSALVMDVGSVKAPVVTAADAAIAGGRFVACHPLAGTEASGVVAADGNIFGGRLCFLCPGPRASSDAVEEARCFWRALGAEVLQIGADQHDALMAAVSHLPHVAAFAMAGSLVPQLAELEVHPEAAVSTTSLRDTTRIAASNPPVWRDIFLENRTHLLPLIRALERQVGVLASAIEAADGQRLEAILTAARDSRERLVRRR